MDGIQAHGDVAEVWQAGRKVGTLFDWYLRGTAASWEATALKQRFDPAFRGGKVEVRFLLSPRSGHVFRIVGTGSIEGALAGATARTLVRLKGDRLWTATTGALPRRGA